MTRLLAAVLVLVGVAIAANLYPVGSGGPLAEEVGLTHICLPGVGDRQVTYGAWVFANPGPGDVTIEMVRLPTMARGLRMIDAAVVPSVARADGTMLGLGWHTGFPPEDFPWEDAVPALGAVLPVTDPTVRNLHLAVGVELADGAFEGSTPGVEVFYRVERKGQPSTTFRLLTPISIELTSGACGDGSA